MNNEKYNCNDCNKLYSCYRSLWTHNKNFHNGIKTEKTIVEEKKPEIIKEENTTEYNCRVCNKIYKYKQGRYKHEKTCTGIKQTSIEIETEKMKQETLKIEQENLKLKIQLQGMKQIDTKTFKAINKLLKDRSITNNTQNNTQNINITNNYQIMELGNENVVESLSMEEKRIILNWRWGSLDKMVELVHIIGPYNKFKNIVITNLKDKYAYRYDESKGYFITTTKLNVLEDIVENRMMDLEATYDELSSANMIDNKTKELIQKFLDKMENEEPFLDEIDTIEYPNFKSYKMNKIKILLYNNRDRITNDIAFLIGDKKENEIINT